MGTLGLESIFIGNVCDSVNNPIGSCKTELSTYGDGFVFSSSIVQLSGFLLGNSVASFKTATNRVSCSPVNYRQNLRKIVSIHTDIVTVVFEDCGLSVGGILGASHDGGHKSNNEYNKL